jgi:hypothetical protein
MNARINSQDAENRGTKPSAPFWLQSTLNDYEVEEVNMWQLAHLLAEAHGTARELDTAATSAASAY